ncbi:succinyl-diaminopimelate desuccinylase [Paraconexibacter antarcticus]|uniref:Succinyl-diaminopimelate desuccinylase n=1 Tax=Paraconexibacter antarcticus TaxID=2949664 RepID=A0ABY5DLQ5_9ACTN|nr:succinyl-diaminopimelate desuccinylase [Paraconexibacter antarcticus]UTI62798.1 succinyl-diaminopimelate desuccinylase [Paraconexibacter antarcticus]
MFQHLSDAELGERLAARTLELVDIPSESRAEDELAAHALGVLQAGGVPARDAGDTCVLADPVGAADGPLVLLGGHFDTVPAQGNIPGSRDATHVHGLGTADMLGAVAVAMEVALALAADDDPRSAPPTARLGLCLFGREELAVAESALTPLLGREPGLRDADLVLMMEPTENTIHAGCLGNINATWTFRGRSGHSARPWHADNAIERAARGITRLTEAAPPIEHVFDGLTFTEVVSVTQIAGGIAQNVIPDEVRAHVNHRYAPGTSAADAEARLHALCGADGESLDITSNAPSGAVCVADPLVQRLIGCGDLPVAPKQAWTPVAEFTAVGMSAVNFGPGAPKHAHQRDERIAVAALVTCARTLDAFLSA